MIKIPTQRKTSKTEILIWVSALILSNFRGTVIWDVLKQGFRVSALPWIEVFGWIVLFILAVRSLRTENLVTDYVLLWRQNWILILFIAVACLSLLWSVSFSASLYRSLALLFSSLIGAYIGLRYPVKDFLNILFRFGALLLMVCLVLAVFLPIVGAMLWEPYNGAWRGVFWHKNQFGAIAALFSMVFLICLLGEVGRKDGKPLLYLVFYLFTMVNIYFSKSVAGYLLLILMSFLTLLAFGWLKYRHRLRPIHYYGVLGFGFLALAVIFLNLNFVFGLFNRDISLTGRIPLWNYLLRDVVAQNPWFGYGFGAIWSLASFRIATQQTIGWGFPVVIGDNGFLDILLHLGLLGFIPFLGVLIASFKRSGKFALIDCSIIRFFPLLVMIFAVVANISFSLFIETETFLWLVIVAVLFIVTKSQLIHDS